MSNRKNQSNAKKPLLQTIGILVLVLLLGLGEYLGILPEGTAAQTVDADHPAEPEVYARHAEIQLEADVSDAESLTLEIMRTGDEAVRLTWAEGLLTLDRSTLALSSVNGMACRMSMPLEAEDGRISLRVYVDACAVEVFAGGETMTALAFPEGEGYGVAVKAAGQADVRLNVWEIN